MVLFETRGLWLFRVVREGLESRVRLSARGTSCLTSQLRLALEPECLKNPTATTGEDPQHGADSIRDTQAVCGFRDWASKHTPLFHTTTTIVEIFLARSGAPSPPASLWPAAPHRTLGMDQAWSRQ